MGMTISEKILAMAAGQGTVRPGNIVTAKVNWCMSNDVTTHLTIDMFENKLREKKIYDADSVVFIVDHNIPAENEKTAKVHQVMRRFAGQHNIKLHEGDGICHQIMLETYVQPGNLVLGADSHTCSYGALGAFGTGVGCADFLYAMATGTTWMMVPETIKFDLKGRFPEGVYARDLMLKIIGTIGANGANYQAMEFSGEALRHFSIDDRIVLCNLAVEAGAKTGIMEPDDLVTEYLKENRDMNPGGLYFKSDKDAIYRKSYTFDLNRLEPVIARPDHVDDVVAVSECLGIKIDQGFIGSCNNGRIEEMRITAGILKGKKVHPDVRLLITPASKRVYLQALAEGLIDIFMDSGAMVMNPNCSVCWGSCQGVIGENEVLLSTGTRNFKGRAGHATSKVYLVSAATVAVSAIRGVISDPRDCPPAVIPAHPSSRRTRHPGAPVIPGLTRDPLISANTKGDCGSEPAMTDRRGIAGRSPQ